MIGEVFWIFLRLGLTSFGGPTAHLGYFREAFVERRKWLTDRSYADLVALCQFLPGPASSQAGMAIGLQRAGFGGLLAAWFAFTMPSAIVLVIFAFGVASFGDVGGGWLQGMKAAAVAVVAQAVLGMARTLTPDARRATVAVAALIAVLLVPSIYSQVLVILVAAGIGLAWLRPKDEGAPAAQADTTEAVDGSRLARGLSRRGGAVALGFFVALLIGLPALAATTGNGAVALVDIFYRAGSLVFGGGHVVLPLLEAETVRTGLVSHDAFLAGYGAAQAVPGPLFTFSAFLGASTTSGPTGILGAVIALLAIFLPAALLVLGALPFWEQLRQARWARRALMGVNAAVVGILGAALYDPVFVQGVTSPISLSVVLAVFVAQTQWKVPAWAAVIGAAVIGQVVL